MPESWRYLSSSCSKSHGFIRGPCSITTTLMPARASSRAMMPPEAPEPTTTKSTVSLVLNVLLAMKRAPSGGVGLRAGIGFEARVIPVVVTEGRLPEVVVLDPDQRPAEVVVVAAVFRQGEQAKHREPPHGGEERGLVDLLQPGDLLRIGCRGERRIG